MPACFHYKTQQRQVSLLTNGRMRKRESLTGEMLYTFAFFSFLNHEKRRDVHVNNKSVLLDFSAFHRCCHPSR